MGSQEDILEEETWAQKKKKAIEKANRRARRACRRAVKSQARNQITGYDER